VRGMTLDLGFAHLRFPDGVEGGIVDVPGHDDSSTTCFRRRRMELLLLVVDATKRDAADVGAPRDPAVSQRAAHRRRGLKIDSSSSGTRRKPAAHRTATPRNDRGRRSHLPVSW